MRAIGPMDTSLRIIYGTAEENQSTTCLFNRMYTSDSYDELRAPPNPRDSTDLVTRVPRDQCLSRICAGSSSTILLGHPKQSADHIGRYARILEALAQPETNVTYQRVASGIMRRQDRGLKFIIDKH